MVYVKINEEGKVEKVGNLYNLLPNVSNPIKLSEEELKEYKVYKPVIDEAQPQPWEYIEKVDYEFDGENVKEIKVIKETPLDEFKKRKKEEIKYTYEQIMNEGFECSNGIKLDCREKDKINWLRLREIIETSIESQIIRDFDNVTHTLEPDVIKTMLNELEEHYKNILYTKWKCEDIIDSYSTYKDVHNFYWRRGIYDENEEFVEWEYNSEVIQSGTN